MQHTTRLVLIVILTNASLVNCNCDPAPPLADAGRPDSSFFDAYIWDAFPGDAGPVDRIDQDQGPFFDAAAQDRLIADVPINDSSESDLGPSDSAEREAGADAGFIDASLGDLQSSDLTAPDQGPFAEAPATPQNPRAFSGSHIRLRCDAADRALAYRAYHAFSPDGPFSAIGQASPIPELMIAGLDYSVDHFFVLRAENNVGLSAESSLVHAKALDGVSTRLSQISGFIRQNSSTVENARVRLYSAVDHGLLVAEARSDAQGHYQMLAPSGFYRGIIAGFDEAPRDGDAFEVGYDSVGYLIFDDDSQAKFLHLLPGEIRSDLDINLGFNLLSEQISGQVEVGTGWPLADLVVEAFVADSPLRSLRVRADSDGQFVLNSEAQIYQLRTFLDVDGDGEQGINEPASANMQVDLTAGDLANLVLSIPDMASISGQFSDSDNLAPNHWSISAINAQSGEVFQRSLNANTNYALTVSAGRSYKVTVFADSDLNGQRSYYDLNLNKLRDNSQEVWSESALPSEDNVAAGQQNVDFNLAERAHIGGQISPAMQPWQICAQSSDGQWMFCDASQPDGHFDLAVQGNAMPYLVYAYQDIDGDARPTPGLEDLILFNDLVDSTLGDRLDISIIERQVQGQIDTSRNPEHPQTSEMIVLQQIVHNQAGGLLCADNLVMNNYARVNAQGEFLIHTGAIGDGSGTSAMADCAGDCSGLILHRAWNLQGNFLYTEQNCADLQVQTYPQNPDSPDSPILLLDSSAGDLSGIGF